MPKTDAEPTPNPLRSGFLRGAIARALVSNVAPCSLPNARPAEPRAAQAPTPLSFFRGALSQAYGGQSWSPSTARTAAPSTPEAPPAPPSVASKPAPRAA